MSSCACVVPPEWEHSITDLQTQLQQQRQQLTAREDDILMLERQMEENKVVCMCMYVYVRVHAYWMSVHMYASDACACA